MEKKKIEGFEGVKRRREVKKHTERSLFELRGEGGGKFGRVEEKRIQSLGG